jgi:hypothetical protein
MRQLILILTLIFLPAPIFSQFTTDFIEQCSEKSGEDATYLKDFQVVLAAAQPDHLPPVTRYPIVLSKNNIYRFSICTAEGSEGEAILQLYDSNNLIFSSYDKNTGEEYNPFNFMCRKTGIYHVFISFREGKEGQAVGILSYVTK